MSEGLSANVDEETLGGSSVRYALVMKNDEEGGEFLHWNLPVPWWLSDKAPSPRVFAIALRDALRREGFSVHLTASTTLTDEVP